jgi:hypothetical protein
MKTMIEKQFSKDLGSCVSYALRENLFPSLDTRSDHFYNQEYAPPQTSKLSAGEMAAIEKMMAKYAALQQYLPTWTTLNQLDIAAGTDAEEAQPGKAYRKVAVDAHQMEIATFVASKVAEILDSYTKGAHLLARASYQALQDFLAHKRTAMIGSFESVTEIEESLGMHAVGTNGNPQALANPVIFVLIEIWLG